MAEATENGELGSTDRTETEASASEAAIAVAEPTRDEETELKPDEPLDEPTADVVSADPEADLARAGELRAAVEALLFASPEPLTVRKIASALGGTDGKIVRAAIKELSAQCDAQARGVQIVEIAGGFQMATREKHAEYVLRLGQKKKRPMLSNATLETLAIIAYRQPIIRAEIEAVRGVESSGTVRNLLDLELIGVVGRKEVIGRPQMYGTTPKFLESFGLGRIGDLPTIEGLRQKLAAAKEAAKAERDPKDEKIAQPELDLSGGADDPTDEAKLEPAAQDDESTEEVDEFIDEDEVIAGEGNDDEETADEEIDDEETDETLAEVDESSPRI